MPHYFTVSPRGKKCSEVLKWCCVLYLSCYVLIFKSSLILFGVSSVCVCTFLCIVSTFPCIISFRSGEYCHAPFSSRKTVYQALPHQWFTSGITWLDLTMSSVIKFPRSIQGSCWNPDSDLRILGPVGVFSFIKIWELMSPCYNQGLHS